MDDQNKSLNERWAEPGTTSERGYAGDETPAAADPGAERRTREIRSEIDQTRGELSETIDAIQEKLRPSNIVANAKDTVRDATVGRVKQMAGSARQRFAGSGRAYSHEYGFVDRVRDNPIPAAIAAASIAWLAFSGRRQRMSPAIYGSTQHGEAYIRETAISEEFDDASEWSAYGKGYEAAGAAGRSVRGVAQDATGRARDMMRETGEGVRRATSTAQTRLQRFVSENPLAAGAVAAAIGATVGLALPETRRENELLGEARDNVVSRAQEAARGAAERVQDAAQRVSDVAGDTARHVGSDQR